MKDKPVRQKKNLDKGLKRSVGKPACCVSKGGSSSNTASLPDQLAKTKDTVSLVNKKIIKIVSLLKLYCKTKKYFQFTSCIAVYKLVYMLISKLVLCIQDSRNLLINIYTNQLYSINLCKIPFYIR